MREPAAVILGRYLFEFSSFAHWVIRAPLAWKLEGIRADDTLCIDALGRPCCIGRDFMAARDEGQFPVRVYLLRDDMPQYQQPATSNHQWHQRMSTAESTQQGLQFKFIEFNERRAMRSKEAARVAVTDPEDPEGGPGWLWMSRKDIKNNIREHGDSPELQKALAAYGAWK